MKIPRGLRRWAVTATATLVAAFGLVAGQTTAAHAAVACDVVYTPPTRGPPVRVRAASPCRHHAEEPRRPAQQLDADLRLPDHHPALHPPTAGAPPGASPAPP
ncbi:hypothetical protein ACFSTC_61595 [Nonomuraea ferruginea]